MGNNYADHFHRHKEDIFGVGSNAVVRELMMIFLQLMRANKNGTSTSLLSDDLITMTIHQTVKLQ